MQSERKFIESNVSLKAIKEIKRKTKHDTKNWLYAICDEKKTKANHLQKGELCQKVLSKKRMKSDVEKNRKLFYLLFCCCWWRWWQHNIVQ